MNVAIRRFGRVLGVNDPSAIITCASLRMDVGSSVGACLVSHGLLRAVKMSYHHLRSRRSESPPLPIVSATAFVRTMQYNNITESCVAFKRKAISMIDSCRVVLTDGSDNKLTGA